MKERKEVDPHSMEGVKELGWVRGKKNLIRIYDMRIESIFNKVKIEMFVLNKMIYILYESMAVWM